MFSNNLGACTKAVRNLTCFVQCDAYENRKAVIIVLHKRGFLLNSIPKLLKDTP